jgi:hypothetical protein
MLKLLTTDKAGMELVSKGSLVLTVRRKTQNERVGEVVKATRSSEQAKTSRHHVSLRFIAHCPEKQKKRGIHPATHALLFTGITTISEWEKEWRPTKRVRGRTKEEIEEEECNRVEEEQERASTTGAGWKRSKEGAASPNSPALDKFQSLQPASDGHKREHVTEMQSTNPAKGNAREPLWRLLQQGKDKAHERNKAKSDVAV